MLAESNADSLLASALAEQAHVLEGTSRDYDPILARVGDARVVLLGEATHGTHEFYRARMHITERLVREKGFTAVAIEGDWPDAERIHRFLAGATIDASARDTLADFARFPQWMWRNKDVVTLVDRLRVMGGELHRPIGFFGLDLYSLHASMAKVLAYLDARDPAAAQRARLRYACFDAFGDEPQHYARAVTLGLAPSCEADVVAQLVEMIAARRFTADDDGFAAGMNARIAVTAEEYYRAMYLGNVSTWNLRDTHMADTLDALLARSPDAKIVVWAHDSHVGDSAAMAHRAERDEITLGHLCRRRHPMHKLLVGFTTHDGTVTAASEWGAPAERKVVRRALSGSFESVFHRVRRPDFLLVMDDLHEAAAAGLREPRLERAIGVVYKPETERWSHYFEVVIAEQYDVLVHFDHTTAIEPLERTSTWERGELPETFPTGL